MLNQVLLLGFLLHPFRHHQVAQAVGHGDDVPGDHLIFAHLRDPVDEGLVDLQAVHVELLLPG